MICWRKNGRPSNWRKLAPWGAVPQLIEILQTSDNPRLAASVLGAIGSPAAMAALVNGLSEEELTLRRNAAQIGLLNAGDKAIQPLAIGLLSSKPVVRRNSAALLGYIDPQRALTYLLRAGTPG